ncbi:hypothetical protein DCCM_4352 [Desulfocucumis palustris]|uniref:Uncharacterized protein n=1 Tax=Desulfocucumis palustris TaxID=1898651 RepID=A0A2L2XFV1_9FIRM|nr:hypothetical protein DCCM_4352 [Desulfocucumis palustris]
MKNRQISLAPVFHMQIKSIVIMSNKSYLLYAGNIYHP